MTIVIGGKPQDDGLRIKCDVPEKGDDVMETCTKIDVINRRLRESIHIAEDIDHGTQFKIVDRVLGKREGIASEENSLVNLLSIIVDEMVIARDESR